MRFGLPLAIALLLACAAPAAAQQPGQMPAAQAAQVANAFATDYGKALIAEFGKALRKDADPACLTAKSIPPAALDDRGRDLLVRWGTHLMEVTTSLIDPKAYAERFPAAAELERLKQNADVKRYLALAEPMRQAKLLDAIVEQFSRYVLVARIKLAQLSPLATGNEELLAKDPSGAAEDALVKFVTLHSKSAALQRFLDLSDQAAAASAASIRKDQVALAGPTAIFKGIEDDLAALCIGRR